MQNKDFLVGAASAVALALLLSACGGGDSGPQYDRSGTRGSLVQNPPQRVKVFTAATFTAHLQASAAGQSLLQLAGAPQCGVTLHGIEYGTVGARAEATNATAALMLPSGSSPACSGPRPVLLYAHGTTADRNYNLGDPFDSGNTANAEAALLAALYVAHGFIVVAPNYAGYDQSRLDYHPYLNADQQSKDMLDALSAARKALPKLAATDSGQLLLSGYSQGGHVAMATHRALQAAGQTVTASAPMSGPYALAALGDAVFYGNVNLGSTIFTPLLVNSFQQAYGTIYRQPEDVYAPTFAPGIAALLPSRLPLQDLFAQGRLPLTTLFSSTPPQASTPQLQALLDSVTPPSSPAEQAALFALGFGANPLLGNAVRLSYLQDALAAPDGAVPVAGSGLAAVAPQSPLRQAFKANDLRNWSPARPVLLCGGKADPTVFYGLNTTLMQSLWSAPSPLAAAPGLLQVLDVDAAPADSADGFAPIRAGFAQAKAATFAAGGASAVVQSYHGSLVAPFCNLAARGFFQQVLAAGG